SSPRFTATEPPGELHPPVRLGYTEGTHRERGRNHDPHRHHREGRLHPDHRDRRHRPDPPPPRLHPPRLRRRHRPPHRQLLHHPRAHHHRRRARPRDRVGGQPGPVTGEAGAPFHGSPGLGSNYTTGRPSGSAYRHHNHGPQGDRK